MINDTCSCGATLKADHIDSPISATQEHETHKRWLEAHASCRAGGESQSAVITNLEAQKAALIEDRARFPDRPDGIGFMIEAHYKSTKASADRMTEAWRGETLRSMVLLNKVQKLEEHLRFIHGHSSDPHIVDFVESVLSGKG